MSPESLVGVGPPLHIGNGVLELKEAYIEISFLFVVNNSPLYVYATFKKFTLL